MTVRRPHPSHFGPTGMPKPGAFKATCRLTRSKPEKTLTAEERAQAKAEDLPRWFNTGLSTPRWEVKFPACTGYDTEDPLLFEGHMLTQHGVRPRAPKQLRLGKGLWTGPKLTEEGRPLEPTGLEPGATVTWRELVPTGETYVDGDGGQLRERPVRDWVERSGQVWCAGWRPKSVWVVPFEPLEGEQAVMVEQRLNGELEHYSTQQSPSRRAA